MVTKNLAREEMRKTQILEAAYEVIALKGCSDFTLEDVANTAGLSKGGILHYFKTKEDILVSLLVMIYTAVEDIITKRAERYRTPERKLKAIIIAYIVAAKRNPAIYPVMIHFTAQMTINERIKDINNKITELMFNEIKKVIEIGIKKGVFNNVNSSNTAYVITSMIAVIAIQWTFNKSQYNIDQMTRTCLAMIMAYLKK